MIVIFGEITDKDESPRVIANKIWEISQESRDEIKKILVNGDNFKVNNFRKFAEKNKEASASHENNKSITINYPAAATPETAAKTKEIFLEHPGDTTVFLRVGEKFVKTNFKIYLTEEFKKGVVNVLGAGAF